MDVTAILAKMGFAFDYSTDQTKIGR